MKTLTVTAAPREFDNLALNREPIRVYAETFAPFFVCEHPRLGMSKKFSGPAESAARRWLAECGFTNVTIED